MASIAAGRGAAPFDVLLDIVLADDLKTVLRPKPTDGDDAIWQQRAEVCNDERTLVGGSRAGAHLDPDVRQQPSHCLPPRLPARAPGGCRGSGPGPPMTEARQRSAAAQPASAWANACSDGAK